jgi:Cys2His2 zinc finger developmental/cell cycle regulator
LKWNNYEASIIQIFQEMLEAENLCDVTIACERQFLKAHKIVLAACSPYFQALFMDNPCKHPIVILKDIRYQDLKSLIDFMYRGEVTVSHEQLPSLLKTAETLQIKQLAEMTTRPTTFESSNQAMRGKKRKRPKAKRSSVVNNASSVSSGHNISGVVSEQDDEMDGTGDTPSSSKMVVVQDSNGTQYLTPAGPDGQPLALESTADGDGNRILEISMADVLSSGGNTVNPDMDHHQQTGDEEGEEDEEDDEDGEFVGSLSNLLSSSGQESDIMLIRKKQSFVWEYFTETGKGSVKCRKCGKLLSYKDTSGSTSNMIKHLKTVHSVERAPKPMLQE